MNCSGYFARLAISPAALIVFVLAVHEARGESARPLPAALPSHPGNVFLEGEEIIVPMPGGAWQLLDADDRVIAAVDTADEKAALGKLPVGFYRLRRENSEGDWVSLAVLRPLRVPTPHTSPVAVDVAMSWFYPPEKMPAVANLCALAGVNWVRDRLAWREIEPRRGVFAEDTRYDAAAEAQSAAGLKVLQVNHSSPEWANPDHRRFPLDLRDCYNFHRHIAARWAGKVSAFEPWNEADIQVFGGHTGAEMASLQKAAYWGIKAGNPGAVACLNVFASRNRAQLEDIRANEAWPYFETFNLHHYAAFDAYPSLYADFREVSGGRPLWVTECAMPLRWSGEEAKKELSDEDLKEQARRLVKVFAGSLHEGSRATFYFLLPHYVEGPTQFGIIRPDLTPRPAYVALAATGRLLADARPMGRVKHDRYRIYGFSAMPDGNQRIVLVAWSDQGAGPYSLPETPNESYDHLGRPLPPAKDVELTASPRFFLFERQPYAANDLEPPPSPPEALSGRPCPVVFQAVWPESATDLKQSAYRIPANEAQIPVYVYHFGEGTASGKVDVNVPSGWTSELPPRAQLQPGERLEWQLRLLPPQDPGAGVHTIRISGDFGELGKAVLSFRVIVVQDAGK
ncbi:MAG: hypothetical protein GYA33_03890 [Thermogutta sp.]|nr:hypothetical protein [Thermogutta sp.]